MVNRPVHGQKTGVKDVYSVDFFGCDDPDSPSQSVTFNLRSQRVATAIGKFLAVVERGVLIIGRQNDGSGIHASGQTTTSSLIATGLYHLFIIMR